MGWESTAAAASNKTRLRYINSIGTFIHQHKTDIFIGGIFVVVKHRVHERAAFGIKRQR